MLRPAFVSQNVVAQNDVNVVARNVVNVVS